MIQNIIFESIEFLIGYPALLQFDEQCEQLECELETIARESKNGNPIDQFTFDTTAQALSPWQGGNIVELNDAGEWFVNTPDIAFNDIGDLLDAEEAMFQELQEGWITYEEFDAFENYVLNHAIGDDNYSYDDDSQTDRLDYNPIGAYSRAMVSSSHSSCSHCSSVNLRFRLFFT
jgi:hypothetical protein